MKLICIECTKTFEDTQKEVVEKGERVMKPLTAKEQAYQHTTRPVSKDSPVRVPLKKHVVFPYMEGR
jgi:hypothetical protein